MSRNPPPRSAHLARWAVRRILPALAVFAAAHAHTGEEFPAAPDPRADYNIEIEIKNLSGEEKKRWPVILTVYRIFGGNLPAGSLNPKGYHVYNEKGDEVEYAIESIPPYDQPGNDELVFIIPKMEKDQTLTYRITNSAEPSRKLKRIDLVNNPNNLMKNPGFDAADKGGTPKGWLGHGRLDTEVKRSGKSSLCLSGLRRQKIKYQESIPLHPGSLYYFGIWGKTDHVARHALYDSKGGYFLCKGFADAPPGTLNPDELKKLPDAGILSQCATRDWAKTGFLTTCNNAWGVPEMCVIAKDDTCGLFFMSLDQRPQFLAPDGHAEGKWWLDEATLFEQPRVTARFDKLLEPHLKDGLFIFTRPSCMNLGSPGDKKGGAFCAKPYPRERLTALDRYGLKGQRVSMLVGIYATHPVEGVQVAVKDSALAGPAGAALPVAEVEFCAGYLPPSANGHWLRPHTQPVNLPAPESVPYFVVSFTIPRDAKAGAYTGSLEVQVDGKPYRSIPVKLRVQDLELPILRDIAVGGIFQSGETKLSESALKQYSKAGYTALTQFGSFMKFSKGANNQLQIDLDHLKGRLEWLKGYGVTAAVTPFSDVDLGPLWGGGTMWKQLGNKEAFKREVKRVEDFLKENPDLPRIIWMTWDEPVPDEPLVFPTAEKKQGNHGGQHERMGWPNEICPGAWTTIDAGFWAWDKILPYYTYANFDEPANYCGPELYRYTKSQGKNFGFAGSTRHDQRARYQVGIMMIGSGARNFHYWHVGGLIPTVGEQNFRALAMVSIGEGLDDLKVHRLLDDALKGARNSTDEKKKALAGEAEAYLKGILEVWNADHRYDASYPYLGLAADWGYDNFFNDWQEKMARFAAGLNGAAWVE